MNLGGPQALREKDGVSRVEEVRRFIVENFFFDEGQTIDDGASFLEAGVLDSTGILELVEFLEQRYNIVIESDELVPENLDSLEKISLFLGRKLDPAGVKK